MSRMPKSSRDLPVAPQAVLEDLVCEVFCCSDVPVL
jgi:hypothetical protein